MNFETAAVEMFPELMTSATITRRQVNDVVAKFKVKYPVHITNPNNNVSRGVFNFSAQMDTNIPAVPVVLETDEAKLMEYLTENVDRLKELSLRTVEKLAVLYLASPDKWITLANSVMIKR